MIAFTDITGLASSAIAITALAARLPGVARLRRPYLAPLLCVVAIATLIPLGDLPLAAYVRGAIGDLSIPSLMLLLLSVSAPLCGGPRSDTQSRFALLALIALAAVGLYPMALGAGLFDPYHLGYGSPWLVGVLLLIALAACWRRLPLVALCLALAVLAWSGGWYESANLWDYLLDPLLATYAIGALIRRGARKLQTLRRA